MFNPLARLDREPFVAKLTDGVPARPLNITAIEATNRGRADMPWAMLTSLHAVPEVGIGELAARMREAVVFDVREPEEYAHGHVPGAVNLPQADLATRLGEVPRDRPVMLICKSGMRSLRSVQFLAQMGYDNVVSVAGGTEAWRAAGREIEREHATAEPRIVETKWAHAGVVA